MNNTIQELEKLFEEAKQKNEFQFVLTLINYRGMGAKELSTNLHEWFEAIEFYKKLYSSHTGKEKTRMGTLLYSTFFENNDFYNIIGSLCKIKLGFKGSSYLFWKTSKYERLLGVGKKQVFLLELLEDACKPNMVDFFTDTYKKDIRNTFFHSAYSLSDDEYVLHDSEPIVINNVGHSYFSVSQYLYPKIDSIILFFDSFKKLYFENFGSYKVDKNIPAAFPEPTNATILGSLEGLKGFKIKNAVQFYGETHDVGIWYDQTYNMWAAHNVRTYFDNIETIEIREGIQRYHGKADIVRNDSEFQNVIDKIVDRNIPAEIALATQLLVKFGNVRKKKMCAETDGYAQRGYPKWILPFYRQAVEIGSHTMDMTTVKQNIKAIEEFMEGK